MKLFGEKNGTQSIAVQMTLSYLNLPYEYINIDYIACEHMTPEYEKMNPQKEIPVLDDNGFQLGEHVAIMQYIFDKYGSSNLIYPKDPKARALVNHRLCFNMGYYYSYIGSYTLAPIFFDYQRNEFGLKKVNIALSVLEKYLNALGTKYSAGDTITLADFVLVATTMCLEIVDFKLDDYPLVNKWYTTFKKEFPKLWEICDIGLKELIEQNTNLPDLSHMNHPTQPIRPKKK